MNYRFMRLLVFFDLPMLSDKNRRDYNAFRKFLIKNGFVMMQKSVYSKIVINNVTGKAVREKVSDNLPPEGLVELLEITENQFSRIEYLVGEEQKSAITTDERLIEL